MTDAVISPHDEHRTLGNTEAERQAAYRELFRCQLDPGTLDQIGDATDHELAVGTSRLKDEIEAMTKRRVRMRPPGRPRRERAEGEC